VFWFYWYEEHILVLLVSMCQSDYGYVTFLGVLHHMKCIFRLVFYAGALYDETLH
jgi:hypothetical protein